MNSILQRNPILYETKFNSVLVIFCYEKEVAAEAETILCEKNFANALNYIKQFIHRGKLWQVRSLYFFEDNFVGK